MAAGDIGEIVVDDARSGDPEIGVGAVIGLVRRGRDRLDVDPHPVHVGQPLLDRGELDAVPLGLLPVDLARVVVGVLLSRMPRRGGMARDHLRGFRGQHMAVNVDGKPFAACMSGPREAARDCRARRHACEEHLTPPPRFRPILRAHFWRSERRLPVIVTPAQNAGVYVGDRSRPSPGRQVAAAKRLITPLRPRPFPRCLSGPSLCPWPRGRGRPVRSTPSRHCRRSGIRP
jgi:hypothetical protein